MPRSRAPSGCVGRGVVRQTEVARRWRWLRTLHELMTRRLMVAIAVIGVATGAALYARGSGGAAQPPAGACRDWFAAPAYHREINSVRTLVPQMKRAFAAPGLSVAIAADGKLVWSQSCGFADLMRRRAVTRTTQFRVGSVSKALTAATVARLDQRGRLDVDDDIGKYLPAFPSRRPAPTLRQLGGHLGGIRHYQGVEATNTKHYQSLPDSLPVFINDPLVAAPGDEFHYSSYGFNLLGAAVETVTRTNFANTVSATLLKPLGMTWTSVGRPPVGGTRFYEVTGARRAVPAPRIDLSDRYPSGGFLSTAEDLVRFGVGITNVRFLDRRSQALLFTPQRTGSGKPTGYGFGFEVGDSPVGPVAGHTGNVVGGTSFILIHPRSRVVVALATNIGFVTAPRPPDLAGTPDPPQLAMPFILRVLARR
jgi:serine beta-lactamase-like protein LACTB, mitochondrial